MHAKRLIVAAIVLPLFYLYVAKLSPLFFLIFLLLAAVLGQTEFYTMYHTPKILSVLGIISGIVLLASAPALVPALSPVSFTTFYPIHFMLTFMLIAATRLFAVRNPSASLRDVAPALIGVLYVPHLLLAQWHLRLNGYEWILFLYGCVWASDSFAYYIGKSLGKRKLYPEVSPNKTVAGAFGSIGGGMLIGVLLGSLLLKDMSVPLTLFMGGAIGTVTIIGDLVESMFKRDAGVKDSGTLIPGHGGVLDKIDGVLFAGPVLYWITLLL